MTAPLYFGFPLTIFWISYLLSVLRFLFFSHLLHSNQPEWSSLGINRIMSLFCPKPVNGFLLCLLIPNAILAFPIFQSYFMLWYHQIYFMYLVWCEGQIPTVWTFVYFFVCESLLLLAQTHRHTDTQTRTHNPTFGWLLHHRYHSLWETEAFFVLRYMG